MLPHRNIVLITRSDGVRIGCEAVDLGLVVKGISARALLLAWGLSVAGGFAASAEVAPAALDPAPSQPIVQAWPPRGWVAAAVSQVDTAAEEIALRLAQDAPSDQPLAQAPSVPAFVEQPAPEADAAAVPGDPAQTPAMLEPGPALALPPEATSPAQPSPAAKACLFAAASTLPLVPDAKITSASAAPIGSMAGDGLYRDFRVILVVDALGMTTTVEFACRSADTPEIFGAEILSARILE